MTTSVIIGSFFLIGLVLILAYLFYQLRLLKEKNVNLQEPSNSIKEIASTFDWRICLSLVIVLLLVLLACYSPFIFTRTAISPDFNFSTTGQIGDTIGGLMNPFIALAGVIVTGLAFYIQYKANQQQRELFLKEQKKSTEDFQKQINHQNKQTEKQEFESQFYEMLKLQRENVTEMKIEGYDFKETKDGLQEFEKITEGRKVFVTMKTELECILSLYSADRKLDERGFKKCYKLFFSGLDAFEKKHPEEKKFTDLLRELRKKHEEPNSFETKIETNKDRKEASSYAHLYFNYKPFSGHASRLGHYFRHLYLTVKSTVNSNRIEGYDEKMRYLKLLRAQLSNHEQILLFYNWLGGHGSDWETDDQPFFTEYCMIHNLWHDTLLENDFIERKVEFLRNKPAPLRKGNMFEID